MNIKRVLASGLAITLVSSMVACTFGTPNTGLGDRNQEGQAVINQGNDGTDTDVENPEVDITEPVDGDGVEGDIEEDYQLAWVKGYYNKEKYDDDYNKIVSATHKYVCPTWYDNSDQEPDTPLYKALREYDSNASEELEGTYEYLVGLLDYQDDMSVGIHEDSIDYVIRSDKEVFSFVTYTEYYYGGNGYGENLVGTTFDAATGEEIQFTDIMDVDENFAEKLSEQIIKDNEAKAEYISEDDIKDAIIEYYVNGEDKINYYLTNKGVFVYFNVYELGMPKVVGAFSAFIDYHNSDFKFKKDCFSSYDANAYVQEMIPNFVYDIAGRDVYVSFYDNDVSDYQYSILALTADGNPYSVEFSSLSAPDLYYVTVGNNNYIYAQNSNYDGLDSYMYFEVGPSEIYASGYIPGYIASMADISQIRFYVMVCFAGYYWAEQGSCFINDIGEICSYSRLTINYADEEYFEVVANDEYDSEFQKLVNEMTMETETVCLPEGTILKMNGYDISSRKVFLEDEAGNIYVCDTCDENGEYDYDADIYYSSVLSMVYNY